MQAPCYRTLVRFCDLVECSKGASKLSISAFVVRFCCLDAALDEQEFIEGVALVVVREVAIPSL